MILVTGCAGFIGYHTCQALLARGERVLGVDNMNAYYEVSLKEARLERLRAQAGFQFLRGDIADHGTIEALAAHGKEVVAIVHLAAQAGVRHSLKDPYVYVTANVMGQVTMLELARSLPALRHFVYASSSSVYGGNTKQPYAVEDRVDRPISLYAATKRAGELIGHTYAHLYGIPATGLRFFTVYGPWGRPDMAAFIFAKAILEGRPIALFNQGRMERDFTYIDDIVGGVLGALNRPPAAPTGEAPHRVYNLGNSHPERLTDFVAVIERTLQRKAIVELLPLQPGDVPRTAADIEASRRDLGFVPRTPIEAGVPLFLEWFRDYYKV